MKKQLLILALPLMLSSCGDTSPDTTITPVNQARQNETVRITGVSVSNITKTNNHNRSLAKTIGALLGTAAGLASVQADGGSDLATAGAGIAGAFVGDEAGGALVKSTQTVKGVEVSFKRKTGEVLSTIEAGKPCQFEVGGYATLVKYGTDSINVLPNARCGKH